MRYNRQELIDLVKRDAVKFGDFTLASGERSTFYIDCRNVTLSARGAALIGAGVLEVMGDEPFDAIGGLTLGADPIISSVITLAGVEGKDLRGFIVRKESKQHGTGKLIEGPLKAGDRVVIVEDVTTTGTSIQLAVRAAEGAGAKVVRIVTVLDRLAGGADRFLSAGYSFSALLTLRDLSLEQLFPPGSLKE